MSNDVRKIVAIVLAVGAAFFLYAVFTLPAISTTAPAILTIACALGAWFLWPRDRSVASTGQHASVTSTGLSALTVDEQRETLARLESDYLRGALPAEEYARLKGQLLGETATPTAPVVPVQTAVPAGPFPVNVDPLTGTHLASWGRRAAAWFIDLVVIAFIWGLAIGWAIATRDDFTGEITHTSTVVMYVVFFAAAPIYQWLMIGTWGQTLGKMALGIKVVRSEDAGRVSYVRALGRAASFALLSVIFLLLILAYLWPLWDKRNQTLYDKMASTLVAALG